MPPENAYRYPSQQGEVATTVLEFTTALLISISVAVGRSIVVNGLTMSTGFTLAVWGLVLCLTIPPLAVVYISLRIIRAGIAIDQTYLYLEGPFGKWRSFPLEAIGEVRPLPRSPFVQGGYAVHVEGLPWAYAPVGLLLRTGRVFVITSEHKGGHLLVKRLENTASFTKVK